MSIIKYRSRAELRALAVECVKSAYRGRPFAHFHAIDLELEYYLRVNVNPADRPAFTDLVREIERDGLTDEEQC